MDYTSQTVANGGLLTDNTSSSGTSTSIVLDRCKFTGLFNGANRLLTTSGGLQGGKLPATFIIKNCEGINNISGTFGYWAHGNTATGTSTCNDVWSRFISVNNKGLTYFENGLGYYVIQNSSGSYPTLYAQTMEGEAFSCLISPSSRTTEAIGYYNPFYTTEFNKFNTLTNGSRTLTFELLIDQNYTAGTAITDENLSFEISYVNTSGETKFYSTRVDPGLGASLTTSISPWSSTQYVINSITHNYDKKKMDVTLPENVKQNTIICVKIAIYTYAPSANDVIFFDPDFGVI